MAHPTLSNITIFADCADFAGIRTALELPFTGGFTTNPSLVSQAGVADYTAYAREVLTLVPDMPVSFEVLSGTPEGMEKEALLIRDWGPNVYVKVPVIDPGGNSMGPLIKKLSAGGVKLNVTCVFTPEQAEIAANSLSPGVPSFVSVFAGRIADVGVDPMPIVRECRDIIRNLPRTELLWASTREVYNIWQAAEAGCGVITAPVAMIAKLKNAGRDLTELSRDAVAAFMRDIARAGVSFYGG